MVQVWFPCVHINIGGGSDDLLSGTVKGDCEQIALITFGWMCEMIAPYLQLNGNLSDLASSTIAERSNLIRPVLGKLDYGNNWIMKNVFKVLDKTGVKKAELMKVALDVVNGWATGPIVDSFTGSMVAAGSITRTPGQYREATFGAMNEKIHPSVRYRMEKLKTYKPLALAGFQRGLRQDKKKDKVVIPEFVIKPEDHFTRHVAMQDSVVEGGASNFIGQTDRDLGAKTRVS